jgi:hypothetical protein
MKKIYVLLLVVLLLASCAYQPINTAYDSPGFFMGIIHGLIAPFALISALFSDVRVYAFPNSGWWYDFGFMIGVGSWASATANR